jgi:hypothetical protein
MAVLAGPDHTRASMVPERGPSSMHSLLQAMVGLYVAGRVSVPLSVRCATIAEARSDGSRPGQMTVARNSPDKSSSSGDAVAAAG